MASIAIVGGGLAGLACAWRLARAGHGVEVLEAGDALGGRVATERRGSAVLEHGADAFARRQRRLHDLAAELALSGALRPWTRSPDGLGSGGRIYALSRSGRWWQAPLVARALSAEGLRSLLPLLRGGLDAALPGRNGDRADERTLGEWLGARGATQPLAALLEPLLVASTGAGADTLSAGGALGALRHLGLGAPLVSFAGGADALCRVLARAVSVRTGCRATAIETETDGARVRYRVGRREGRLIADAAVVAVPGDRVASLCPKLTPAERGFLAGARYAPTIVVTLLCDRAPRELAARRVWFDPADGGILAELRADHNRPGAARHGLGLLRGTLTPRAVRRLWEATDAELADAVFEQLAYLPIGRVAPREFAVRRWPAAFALPLPGGAAARRRFARRVDRSPRLVFAGDYTEGGGHGVEAALASGLRAADEIARAL